MLSIEGIERLVEPVLTNLGFVLHDIELKREGRELVLRLVVDRDKREVREDGGWMGITVDELAHASDEVGAMLDLENPIEERYRLTLESPGIERDLSSWRQFVFAVGEKVRVVTRGEDSAVVEGELLNADDETRTIEILSGGERVSVDTTRIKSARTVFDWVSGQKRKF